MAETKPTSLQSNLTAATKVGALAGVSGLVAGGISGILRSRKHPFARSIAFGIQWSVFGASYWLLRSTILNLRTNEHPSGGQRALASTVAGGIAGGVTTYTLGSRRFLPGFIMLSLGSFLGQKAYDFVDDWQLRKTKEAEENPEPPKPLAQRMLESKWLLMKPLSDEDYVNMLEERKMNVEVQISLLDEKMEELRQAVAHDVKVTGDNDKAI
ncbi:hypothetical protein KEM55_002342 [Ascosphaera atra]|nr:hypothetical protein KEM55_002342 [Ascosphaera atra]